jgi:biotin operon repressor
VAPKHLRGYPQSRKPPDAHRLVRVLRILRLIQQTPWTWTRAALAEHLGMSKRMIDNDLRLLRLAGYDVRRRCGGGYYLGGYDAAPGPSAAEAILARRRQQMREHTRAMRARRRAAGLCIACGKRPADPAHTRCAPCRADRARAAALRR